jgi:hypothetical protein
MSSLAATGPAALAPATSTPPPPGGGAGRSEAERRHARRARGGLSAALLLAGALAAGCSGIRTINAEVSSFGTWPAGRAPGTYAFERLPSQQSRPEDQAAVEAAAAPALAAAGFKPAAAGQADVLVQVAAAVRVRPSPYNDYYGPRGRWGWGWGLGGAWGGPGWGFGMSYEPPWTEMQVDLLIRDRRTHAALYETHASWETIGSVGGLMRPLFEAALKDFPGPAISPRTVTVVVTPSAGTAAPR